MKNISMDISQRFNFSIPVQIRMSDLDPFVHVNNGAQCNFFDLGRSAYFEHVFGGRINWNTLDLVLVHIELDFASPIKIHDTIICETAIHEIGEKSLKMIQRLRDKENNIIKTTCRTILAGLDRENEKSIPVQEIYKQKIRTFEGMG